MGVWGLGFSELPDFAPLSKTLYSFETLSLARRTDARRHTHNNNNNTNDDALSVTLEEEAAFARVFERERVL